MNGNEYCYGYPHPAVTADCVVFGFDGKELNVLLIQRGNDPYRGKWAFPGGFVNIDESAEEGALRELNEETGLQVGYLEQFQTYSNPERDPRERVISVAYLGLTDICSVRGGDDASEARWFPVGNLPSLAFDHEIILHDALKRLREQSYFYPIAYYLMPERFTMAELFRLYQIVLDKKLDILDFEEKVRRYNLLLPDDDSSQSEHITQVRFKFNISAFNKLRDSGFIFEF